MSQKTIGRVILVLGALGLMASLAANPLGLGSNPREFGWLQTLGAILGCVAIAAGMWLSQRDH